MAFLARLSLANRILVALVAVAVAVFGLLTALELYTALVVAWVTWTVLCIYSWVAPPLLRRWLGGGVA